MIVVDASVVVKCYLPEVGSAEALSVITGREKLIAPQLLRLEVHSAIIRHYRENALSREEVERHSSAFERHLITRKHVELYPDDNQLSLARKIALDLRHPIQDCLYLALAVEQGASLLTADDKFHSKAGKTFDHVKLLRNIPRVSNHGTA
ncbi:type II toxin-antitoxin system VapC family toxin [Telmatocola sphagniphila]|uniref:Type II toxin-antitoxin system VapC family toxin n=1 Tax=Telmatocola sphagniphila TaxID=1123043 RepID=A0A8E6EU48_9BACT|nr:type II toxin-antitoxin system VapC family toxin [Telmatocola sphagniphila]QVL30802.1 type II toxin-antitoxin system VapC family toxin [Telmatocola sphagniphila]